MNAIEKVARVDDIQAYLSAIGAPVSRVQAHEVLAKALGFKNKHVLAAHVRQEAVKRAQGQVSQGEVPSFRTGQSVPRVWAVGQDLLPVMRLGTQPLSLAQMQAKRWMFDIIIPVPLDKLGDIEETNDHVSALITGEESALEDLKYTHVPGLCFGEGFVAYRVQAYVSRPEDYFDLPDTNDANEEAADN